MGPPASCSRRPRGPQRSSPGCAHPHFENAPGKVDRAAARWGMSNRSCTPVAADGADHRQQQLDALHENGPERLWKETGDHAHLLSEIAQEPRGMFYVEEHDSATYVRLLRTLHEEGSPIDALEARSVDALSGATRREQIEAARDDTAHEVDSEIVLEKIEKQADLLSRTEITLATR